MQAFCCLLGFERDKIAEDMAITLGVIVHLIYALFVELEGPCMRAWDVALFESELLIALDVRTV